MAMTCATMIASPVSDHLPAAKAWDAAPISARSGSTATGGESSPEERERFPSAGVPMVEDRFDSRAPRGSDAESAFDLRLAAKLFELMGVRMGLSLTVALGERFNAKPAEVERAVRLLLRCFRMLHLCGYDRQDVEVIVAHASAYIRILANEMKREGQPEMELTELANVLCVLMYIAHSYTQDQNCPLHIWHKFLFRQYCTVKTLNSAAMGLLERLNYSLRVKPQELRARLSFLQAGDEDIAAAEAAKEFVSLSASSSAVSSDSDAEAKPGDEVADAAAVPSGKDSSQD